MRLLINSLRPMIDYLFPQKHYQGKKITDKKWICLFIPFAPYTAILLCGLMLMCGMTAERPFLQAMITQIFVMMLIWIIVFLRLSTALKKRHRSPATTLLIANLFPLMAFLGLCLILGVTSPTRTRLTKEHKQFSSLVDDKIKARKESIAEKADELETKFYKQQAEVKKAIKEIGDRMPDVGALGEQMRERMNQRLKDEAEASKKYWAKVDADMEERAIQKNKAWKKTRDQWLKDHKMEYFKHLNVGFTKEDQEEDLVEDPTETPLKD